MSSFTTWSRRGRSFAMALVLTCVCAASAQAQGAVGSGPLTSALADTEPESGVMKMGPLRLAPGLTIRELGTDDNVFDETDNPKRDYVVAGTPDLSVFTRLRFLQVSTYVGSDMQYYKKYSSERSIGHSVKGRLDLLMGRVFPFIGGGQVRNRTRPNGEIDVRANIQNNEFSGGIGYELSAHAQMFAAAVQSKVDYKDAFQDNVSLEQSLTHTGTEYQLGVKTDLTPLLSLQVRGGLQQDKFPFDPTRNGESRSGTAVFTFDAAAVLSGFAALGYQDYVPVDPKVKRHRGLTANVAITYPFLEIGRFNLGYRRNMDYSFDVSEGYYITNALLAAYTHRLFGMVDFQAMGTRSYFDYGKREGSVDRQDTLDSINGNLGYNLPNRTRVSVNYEFAERRSPAVARRNYVRRRVFLSWLVAF